MAEFLSQDRRAELAAVLARASGAVVADYDQLVTAGSGDTPDRLARRHSAARTTLAHLDLLVRLYRRLAGEGSGDGSASCDEADLIARARQRLAGTDDPAGEDGAADGAATAP